MFCVASRRVVSCRGVVWCGVVWYGMVWCGMVWHKVWCFSDIILWFNYWHVKVLQLLTFLIIFSFVPLSAGCVQRCFTKQRLPNPKKKSKLIRSSRPAWYVRLFSSFCKSKYENSCRSLHSFECISNLITISNFFIPDFLFVCFCLYWNIYIS